jgi:hypothetical protein
MADFSLKEKAVLGIIGMALVWILFDSLFYRPVARELGGVNAHITELTKQVEQSKQWSEKIAPVRQQVELELETLKLPYLIESTRQVAEFNRIIDSALDRQNIQVRSMIPGNVKPVPGKQYQLMTYSQELNCDYNQLGSYISELENANMLIEVADLQVNPSVGEDAKQKVVIQLNAYLFNFE